MDGRPGDAPLQGSPQLPQLPHHSPRASGGAPHGCTFPPLSRASGPGTPSRLSEAPRVGPTRGHWRARRCPRERCRALLGPRPRLT